MYFITFVYSYNNYSLLIVSAIGSEADFGSVSRDYTFRPSPNIRQTIVVPIRIINDVFVEHRETLDSIISLSVADSRIRLDPAEASINIIDDDCKTMILQLSLIVFLTNKETYIQYILCFKS